MGVSFIKRKFYDELVEKLVVYDPLDRPIPKETKDQSIRRDDLLDILEN